MTEDAENIFNHNGSSAGISKGRKDSVTSSKSSSSDEQLGAQNVYSIGELQQKNAFSERPHDQTLQSESNASLMTLKEYGSLSYVTKLFPSKGQKGFRTFPIRINCIDANRTHICFACNINTLFLYNRSMRTVQRLKCANSGFDNITSIKLSLSIDLMIAAGSQTGSLIIFRIPLEDESKGNLEKYVMEKLHRHSITCLQWSQNSMKLYSGDSYGLIGCTKIDYDNHACYTIKVIQENSSIIQLDYHQQLLLFSTFNRAGVCYVDEDNRIIQLGIKERKCHGKFGAQFQVSDFPTLKKVETLIFTTRPGSRLWKADASGVVIETILYKDFASKEILSKGMPSDRPKSSSLDLNCRQILIFQKNYLIIYSENVLFVINHKTFSVHGTFESPIPILCVCATDDEIIILQQSSILVRLATAPETEIFTGNPVVEDSGLKSDIASVQSSLKDLGLRLNDFTSQSNLGAKFKEKLKHIAVSPAYNKPVQTEQDVNPRNLNSTLTDLVSVPITLNKDEQFDNLEMDEYSSKKVKLKTNDVISEYVEGKASATCDQASDFSKETKELSNENSNDKDKDLSELVFKPKKLRIKKKVNVAGDSLSINQSDDSDTSSDLKTGRSQCDVTKDKAIVEVDDDNPTDVITQKQREEFLANILTLDVKLAANDCKSDRCIIDTPEAHDPGIKTAVDIQNTTKTDNASCDIYGGSKSTFDEIFADQPDGPAPDPIPELPMSINNIPNYSGLDFRENVLEIDNNGYVNELHDETRLNDHWMLHCGPSQLASISICKWYFICVDVHGKVYYSLLSNPGMSWLHLNYRAHHVTVSFTGNNLLRIHDGVLYFAEQGNFNPKKPVVTSWIEIMRNVCWASVDDSSAWLIKDSGTIYRSLYFGKSDPLNEVAYSKLEKFKFKQVECLNGVVWGLTNDKKIMCLTDNNARRIRKCKWQAVKSTRALEFNYISLCPNKTGWGIDDSGIMYFKTGVTQDFPGGVDDEWWEVRMSGYVYQDTSNLNSLRNVMDHLYHEKFLNVFQSRQINFSVATGSNGVWICSKDGKEVWGNNSYITGHRLDPFYFTSSLSVERSWKHVSAYNITGNRGTLWILNTSGKLFYIELMNLKLEEVPLPNYKSSIACIAPSVTNIWALTTNGEVWILPVDAISSVKFSYWERLPLDQLGEVHFVHISCSKDVVWACNNNGDVYLRIGSLKPPSSTTLAPAWIPVDTYKSDGSLISKETFKTPVKGITEKISFTKIYVGSEYEIVWALDHRKNVYVRDGISENYHVGTHWVYVCGIQAEELAVSNTSVWAVTNDGSIYRRFGISDSNYVGDYWRKIPGHLKNVTVTSDDYLWGLKNNGIYQHIAYQLQFEKKKIEEFLLRDKSVQKDGDEDGWEVV